MWITILVVAVCLALVYFNYRHNHHFKFNKEKLSAAVDKIFAEPNAQTMQKNDFLWKLKHIYGCTHKEANFLLGAAKKLGMIAEEGQNVRKL